MQEIAQGHREELWVPVCRLRLHRAQLPICVVPTKQRFSLGNGHSPFQVVPIGSVSNHIRPLLSDCPSSGRGIPTVLSRGHPLRHPGGERGERMPEFSISKSSSLFPRSEQRLSSTPTDTPLWDSSDIKPEDRVTLTTWPSGSQTTSSRMGGRLH